MKFKKLCVLATITMITLTGCQNNKSKTYEQHISDLKAEMATLKKEMTTLKAEINTLKNNKKTNNSTYKCLQYDDCTLDYIHGHSESGEIVPEDIEGNRAYGVCGDCGIGVNSGEEHTCDVN